MFGISYGELFLILGATVALIGPKDLPKIARTAGRLSGRAIGYVQMARGQLDSVLQQSQASKVHKELQETLAQLEAIRYEMRAMSIMNPGPFTRRVDTGETKTGREIPETPDGECEPAADIPKGLSPVHISVSSSLHSQATAYARLSEASSMKAALLKDNGESDKMADVNSRLTVLPVSAEGAGLLPKHSDETKGSDILLEALVEAEVAHNAKHFFSQPENQIHRDE